MIARTEEEKAGLRQAGNILTRVLRETAARVVPGVSTAALDLSAEKLVRAAGAVPAFLNYQPEGAKYPFPAALCVSVNDEVVHGIPSEERLVKDGDLVMLDLGLSYGGYFADAALTICAGACDEKGMRLIRATEEALEATIKVARPGAAVGDLGAAIEAVAKKYGFGVVEELGGHSLGRVPHEKPFVSNVGKRGEGVKLVEGLVLAIEPMVLSGGEEVVVRRNGWTVAAKDRARTAHFEHTVAVTRSGAQILTK